MTNRVPLNQQYRIERTLADWPEVADHQRRIESWVEDTVRWDPDGEGPRTGRSYDDALALASIDFRGAQVLEVGARASFLGAYVTRWARAVHVTDLFGDSHSGLGGLDEWTELWRRAAPKPDRLTTGQADMTALEFGDHSYDIVICKSTVEHLRGTDDMQSAQEMARVLRPGGLLYLTTDTAESFRRCRGLYYDEQAMSERLIGPSGCQLHGPADLSWENADKYPHRDGGFERSCCAFTLRKPAQSATPFGDYADMYGSVPVDGAVVLDIGGDYGTSATWFAERGARAVYVSERNPEWRDVIAGMAARDDRITLLDPVNQTTALEVFEAAAPDVVKLDCEGCEKNFLALSDERLGRPEAWVMETHTRDLYERWRTRLERVGYEVRVIKDWEADGKCIKVLTATR